MKQYLNLMQDILDNGVQKEDRTGTGTRELFGAMLRFDLSEGFPLITTKRINVKAFVNEFLWMVIHGSTDVRWLQERGHTFWNPWMLEDCTIGKGYGYQMRRIEHIRKIDNQPSIINNDWSPPFPIEYDLCKVPDNYQLVGTTHSSKRYGNFIVIEELPPNRHPGGGMPTKFQVQFLKTGYNTVLTKQQIFVGEVRDPWYPQLHCVGFLGEYNSSHTLHKSLYKQWVHMLGRCYNKTDPAYYCYGEKGVRVCDSWLCYATFQEQVQKLDGWNLKFEWPDDYSLDKDILGGRGYSPTTCVWASHEEQSRNKNNVKLLTATNIDGRQLTKFGFAGISKATGVQQANLFKVFKGERKHTDGWSLKEADVGGKISVQIIDQVKRLLSDLKHNPTSRRHIIDLWSPADLNSMALHVCHMMTQWNVRDNKLDCLMYQRSADFFVGVPWNFAFYALFTHVVAKMIGLEVGEFIWTCGSCHIYNNHIDQAKLQLSREPRDLPTMLLKDRGQGLDDWEYDDFTLRDYDPHPGIKAKVSV